MMQEDREQLTIPRMVEEVRAGKMPRRAFTKALAVLGISAGGITIIAEAAMRVPGSQRAAPVHVQEDERRHLQLHDEHLANQAQGNLGQLHDDYAEDAIVEDSMHPRPFVGRQAIIARKGLGMAATSNMQINVTNRVVHGNQITVEWLATGTHTGELAGVAASQRDFTLRGVTVTVRRDGKIVRESLYYNPAELLSQIREV